MRQMREFVVFGLGRFGYSVATSLAESGCDVLAVDMDDEKIHDIADIVTHAIQADVRDEEVMESLGLSNFDGAIVAIGENLEAAVLATMKAKELGIPYVMAKVGSDTHAHVMKKVGADMVVFPEKESGMRIANKLMHGNFFDAVALSSTYSMMEIDVQKEWIGHSLRDLEIRNRYGINVIGIRHGDEMNINPDPGDVLHENDELVVIGSNKKLSVLQKK